MRHGRVDAATKISHEDAQWKDLPKERGYISAMVAVNSLGYATLNSPKLRPLCGKADL